MSTTSFKKANNIITFTKCVQVLEVCICRRAIQLRLYIERVMYVLAHHTMRPIHIGMYVSACHTSLALYFRLNRQVFVGFYLEITNVVLEAVVPTLQV